MPARQENIMSKKSEFPIEPGITAKGVPLSQLDTTGYDFGGTMTDAEIEAELDAMENDPEFSDMADEDEADEGNAV
jgi:hypothetical protein